MTSFSLILGQFSLILGQGNPAEQLYIQQKLAEISNCIVFCVSTTIARCVYKITRYMQFLFVRNVSKSHSCFLISNYFRSDHFLFSVFFTIQLICMSFCSRFCCYVILFIFELEQEQTEN